MNKEKFDITGMTCSAGSTRVEQCARKLPGVSEVSANLLKNRSDGEWSTLYVRKFLSFIRRANNSDIFSIYVDMGKDYFHQLNEQNSLLIMSDHLNEEKIEEIASAIMNLSK